MGLSTAVKRICEIPAEFYAGTKSMLELVSDSGVDECPSALSVPNIAAYIKDHPDLLEQWLRWSDSKRVTSGWFFRRQALGYEIGFHPGGEVLHVTEPEIACAEFIVREMRSLIAMPRTKRLNN